MRNLKINIRLLLLIFGILINKLSLSQVSFSPKNYSGLKLWLTGDSVNISNSNFIDKCYDLSNRQNHSIQTNILKQPTSIITSLNNHKVMRFDGVDDFMSFNEVDSIRTCFFLLKNNPGSSSDYPPILGHRSLYDFIGTTGALLFGSAYVSPFISNGIMKENTLMINPLTANKPANYSILSIITTDNIKAEYITNDRNSFGYWKGDYVEIIIYNQALTPSQVIQVENYLLNKYTPKLNLGPDIIVSPLASCIPSNTVSIQANPEFQSFLWSNGNTNNQITVSQYGEYSVICKDIFGIEHYDTVKVIPAIKTFNYPLPILCGTNPVKWDTHLTKTNNQFQWQDSSTDSLLTITSIGQYYVTITDAFGCAYNSNTLTVTQDNFATTASLGSDVSLCSGNSITLASGASPTNTYTWSTGSNNDSLLIMNGGQYSVIVTNTNNCVAKDTINVTVIGAAPTAQFNFNIGCKNRVVTFSNTSTAPAGNIINQAVWDFGDAGSSTNTSTLTNPFHTYADTGFYTIKLTVYTTVGCQQSYKKTIHVAPTPTVNFASSVACQNDSTAFSNQSIGSTNYSISSIIWNFSDPASGANTSNLQLPKHLFSNQGLYPVKLIAINTAGCKDSLTKIITVNGQVKADFTYSPACFNSPTFFKDNSIVPASPNYLRSWNIAGSAATGTLVSKTFVTTGVYSVTLALTSTTSGTNTCASRIVKQINVFFAPIVSFSLSPFCSNDTSVFVNSSLSQSGIISNYNWKLNNNTFSAIQNPTFTATNAGSYPIKLIVTNSFGCKDSATNLITVLPLPTISYSTNPSPYLYINTPVTFFPSITNGNYYNWVFNNIGNYAIQNPTVNFSSIGTYTVTLTIKDNQNCKNTKTSTFNVIKRYLDLAILDVKPEKTANNYMVVKADLANFGSIPITNFDINYTVNNGGNVIESWNGTLNPGNILNYNFTAKTALNLTDADNITCVTIQSVNFVSDENSSNNTDCKALNTGNMSVLDPYPNPTDGNITLPIILDKETDYRIEIYNSIGQITSEEMIKTGVLGLNLVTVDTQNYVRGCFVLKISINDKIYIKKFLKLNKD